MLYKSLSIKEELFKLKLKNINMILISSTKLTIYKEKSSKLEVKLRKMNGKSRLIRDLAEF